MKPFRQLVCILLLLLSQAHAESLVLPAGIALDPAPPLDLTYQVIPAYDPNQKVLAGWDGEKLQYLVIVEKLPTGWFDAKVYFQGFIRDMNASGLKVESGRTGEYQTTSSLAGRYLEVRSKSKPDNAPTTQLVHFMTDGKVTFIAIATLVGEGKPDRMLDETKRLFQSASLPSNPPMPSASDKAEHPYVGNWTWRGTTPNGTPAMALVTLKNDLSFSTEMTVGGQLVFKAVGLWSVSDKRLLWTYLRSEPALPEDKREDEDEIISLTGGKLVLKSKLSGQQREFAQQ